MNIYKKSIAIIIAVSLMWSNGIWGHVPEVHVPKRTGGTCPRTEFLASPGGGADSLQIDLRALRAKERAKQIEDETGSMIALIESKLGYTFKDKRLIRGIFDPQQNADKNNVLHLIGKYTFKWAMVEYAVSRDPRLEQRSLHEFCNYANSRALKKRSLVPSAIYDPYLMFTTQVLHQSHYSVDKLGMMLIGAMALEGHLSSAGKFLLQYFENALNTMTLEYIEPEQDITEYDSADRGSYAEFITRFVPGLPDIHRFLPVYCLMNHDTPLSTPNRNAVLRDAVWGDAVLDHVIIGLLYNKFKFNKEQGSYEHIHRILSKTSTAGIIMKYLDERFKIGTINGGAEYYSKSFEALVAGVYDSFGGFKGDGFNAASRFIALVFSEYMHSPDADDEIKAAIRLLLSDTDLLSTFIDEETDALSDMQKATVGVEIAEQKWKFFKRKSYGTGVIIGESMQSWFVLTNYHIGEDVFSNRRNGNINIVISQSSSIPAKVVCYDADKDLAMVKIEKKDVPSETIVSKAVLAHAGDVSIDLRGKPVTVHSIDYRKTWLGAYKLDQWSTMKTIGSYRKEGLAVNTFLPAGASGSPIADENDHFIGIYWALAGTEFSAYGSGILLDHILDFLHEHVIPGLTIALHKKKTKKNGAGSTTPEEAVSPSHDVQASH